MIHAFCKDLSLYPRDHSIFHDDHWFNVDCFPTVPVTIPVEGGLRPRYPVQEVIAAPYQRY